MYMGVSIYDSPLGVKGGIGIVIPSLSMNDSIPHEVLSFAMISITSKEDMEKPVTKWKLQLMAILYLLLIIEMEKKEFVIVLDQIGLFHFLEDSIQFVEKWRNNGWYNSNGKIEYPSLIEAITERFTLLKCKIVKKDTYECLIRAKNLAIEATHQKVDSICDME